MTEYEVADLLASAVSNMWSGMGVLFTVLTAYLVAAYVIGKKLPRGQLAVVNVTFAIAWFVTAIPLSTTLRNIFSFREMLGMQVALVSSLPLSLVSYVFFALLLAGPYYFMWSVRNDKHDGA